MPDLPDKVHLLMFRAEGGGGVARTVINLANELVKHRPVEIISLYWNRGELTYWLDPRVELTQLIAGTPRNGRRKLPPDSPEWLRELDRLPTSLATSHSERPEAMSAYSDHVLAEKIRSITTGVLVSTRPSLHVAAVRNARPEVVVVGQDHLNFPHRMHNKSVMAALAEAVPRLDSYVVLTHGDLADYRRWAPPGSRIDRIPNGHTSPPQDTQGDLANPVLISAGRLVRRKGFARLVEGWAPLAPEFPDWQLHIYGDGEEESSIRQTVADLGVGDSVVLKGYSRDFDRALAESSGYVMGSTSEGFPMVLVEAMGKGLPLVAFDCPRGPADMIEDGVNGRLVPDGDIAAYTEALREIVSDPVRRRQMGAAGLERAADYQMTAIGARWTALFDELLAERARGGGPRRPAATDETGEAGNMSGTTGSEQGRGTVVVVAGSGRSGTSTIAGVLKTIGLQVPPPEVPGNATNPRGFFEPKWVVDQQSKLLRMSQARLTDARPSAFASTEEVGAREENRRVVGAWLAGHAHAGVELVVKDPRSSWFLPMWRRAAADAGAGIAFLTMLRHPAEVVGSKDHYYKAAKAGDTPRHAQTRGAAGWVNVALQTEYSTRDARRTFVRYNDLLDDWRAVVAQLARDLGLEAAHDVSDEVAARVDEFVDPGLRRIRTEWHEVDCPDAVRDLAQEVWEQLCLLADNGGFHEEAEQRLDACRERYQQMYADAEALAQSSIDAAAGRARRQTRAAAEKSVEEKARKLARRIAREQARKTAPAPPPRPLGRVNREARRVARGVLRRVRS